MCHRTPKQAEWYQHREDRGKREPTRDRCLECGIAADSFAPLRTWEEVVNLHGSSADFRAEFEAAKSAVTHPAAGRAPPGVPAPPWNPTHVTTGNTCGIRVAQNCLAVDSRDFIAFYEMDPRSVPGLQVTRSIPPLDGNPNAEHVLFAESLEDPLPPKLPKRRCEVYFDMSTCVVETVMAPMQQRRPQQAMQTFQSMSNWKRMGPELQRPSLVSLPPPASVAQKVKAAQDEVAERMAAKLAGAVGVGGVPSTPMEPVKNTAAAFIEPSVGPSAAAAVGEHPRHGKAGRVLGHKCHSHRGGVPSRSIRGALHLGGAPKQSNPEALVEVCPEGGDTGAVASQGVRCSGASSQPGNLELTQEDLNSLYNGAGIGCKFNGIRQRIKSLRAEKQHLKAQEIEDTLEVVKAARCLNNIANLSWRDASQSADVIVKAGFELQPDAILNPTKFFCWKCMAASSVTAWVEAWRPFLSDDEEVGAWDHKAPSFATAQVVCTSAEDLALLQAALYDSFFCEGLVTLFQADDRETIHLVCHAVLDVADEATPPAPSSDSDSGGAPSGQAEQEVGRTVLANIVRVARGLLKVGCPEPGIRQSTMEDVDFVFPESLKRGKMPGGGAPSPAIHMGHLSTPAFTLAKMLKDGAFPSWLERLQAFRIKAGGEMQLEESYHELRKHMDDIKEGAPDLSSGWESHWLAKFEQLPRLRAALRDGATQPVEQRMLAVLEEIWERTLGRPRTVAEDVGGAPSASDVHSTMATMLSTTSTLLQCAKHMSPSTAGTFVQAVLEKQAEWSSTHRAMSLDQAAQGDLTSEEAVQLLCAHLKASASLELPLQVKARLKSHLGGLWTFCAQAVVGEYPSKIYTAIQTLQALQKVFLPSGGAPSDGCTLGVALLEKGLCQTRVLQRSAQSLPEPLALGIGPQPSAEEKAEHLAKVWSTTSQWVSKAHDQVGVPEDVASALGEILGHLRDHILPGLKAKVEEVAASFRAAHVQSITQATALLSEVSLGLPCGEGGSRPASSGGAPSETHWASSSMAAAPHQGDWASLVAAARVTLFRDGLQARLDSALENSLKAPNIYGLSPVRIWW